MTRQATVFEPRFTVFMLLKTAPECLGLTGARAREMAQEALSPFLKKHASKVTLSFFDVEFYSARVSDIWIWRAKDVHAYHHLLGDLRQNTFWNRHFKVVEILAGVEEAHARKYYRELIPTWADSGFIDTESRTMMQDVVYP
jgi:hypothetical protein